MGRSSFEHDNETSEFHKCRRISLLAERLLFSKGISYTELHNKIYIEFISKYSEYRYIHVKKLVKINISELKIGHVTVH